MTKIKNFTPLLDILVKEHGLITAAVWGRVYRYEQMNSGKCLASHEKLSEGLNISKRTLIRHLNILIDKKYIMDHTPKLRNRPHELTTTSKARLEITIEAVDEGVTESHTGMTESHSEGDRESHEESIKKESKKQKSKTSAATAAGPPDPPPTEPEPEKVRVPNEIRKHAETVFREVTGLEPLPVSRKGKKDPNGATWWEPLRTICIIGNCDRDLIRALIEGAVKKLTMEYVFTPNSLMKTIPKIKAGLNGHVPGDHAAELARRREEARRAFEEAGR